jgi:acetate kinase
MAVAGLMRVLTLNPGSSSLKLAVVEGGEVVAESVVDRWDGTSLDRLDTIADAHGRVEVDAAAVRIVHGGGRTAPAELTPGVIEELERLVPLAPLHQPRSLALARRAADSLPGIPLAGCFDTAFHTGLPARASTYAVPETWRVRHGVRRYGFHGLSVAHACRRAARLLGSSPGELEMVCCHIGAGVSITAVAAGRSVDTSMGMTPLDGVPMATRPGALDPGILLYLQGSCGLSRDEIAGQLEHGSGLAGLSGTGGDIRDVLHARALGDPAARLAFEVYVHRLRREIAAAAVSLPRLDAVVFTGGVAQHQPALRAELVTGTHLGITMAPADEAGDTGSDRIVSAPGSRPAALVVISREDVEMARQTERLIAAEGRPAATDAGPPPEASRPR